MTKKVTIVASPANCLLQETRALLSAAQSCARRHDIDGFDGYICSAIGTMEAYVYAVKNSGDL